MFQKPAFGANTSGFGAGSTFGATSASATSPFSGFKPAAAGGAFGAAPAFGAPAAAQPAQPTGLFGAASTSGGLFGAAAPAAAAPAFGATSGGFGFGATSGAAGGLFNSGGAGGMFQPQQTGTTFGAKPAGFGFGGTTSQNTSGGLFGNTQQAGTTLFGQQNNTMASGGLFGNTQGGFGAAAAPTGTAHVKYAPLVGTDVVMKSGASQNINIKHHCITCMKEYENKSLEELRLEDYTAGRKGSSSGMFGFNQPAENKPLFGAQTSTFGAPATSAAPSVFGGASTLGTSGGFGQANTSFSFGGATQANTNTSGLFGAQPFGQTSTAGTSLFGATPATQASTFGTNTSTFGFGSNLQNQTTGGGLFGAKPATAGFGAPAASTSFGAFSGGAATGGLFGAKPLQTQAPAFGAPQAGVGSMAGGFGTSTSTAGGLFGGAGFGKPATATPSFGFGAPQATLGLNTGLGANTFGQAKPAVQGFGTLGGGLFPQAQNNNTFRTGLDSGLGGGLFGNTSGALGLGAANNNHMANLSGASAAGNVHEQILALAARPYGDSPLFKDLLPDSTSTAEEALKPTNPAAQAAVMARSEGVYRVTSPTDVRLPLRPRAQLDKKSLFDGLEQSDASLDDKLSLKPSRKRLVLRPQHKNDFNEQTHRSPEESISERPSANSLQDKENANLSHHSEDVDRVKRNIDFPNNNTSNADSSTDRQVSWLGSSKLSTSWNRQELPIDGDTPRLYPNLEKDLRTEVSERRASWLTTKTLRPPPLPSDSAENSVRELGLRSEITSPVARDKDELAAPEEEPAPRPAPPHAPHPAGVKCTRPGYYTIPSLEEMTSYLRPDGTCIVPHLTIGRTNYGNVHFDSEIDVAGLDIDTLVHFLNKEVIVYPTDADKPRVGEGLNRRAVVTLDRIWPRDKTQHRPIDDPQRLLKMEYEGKLRRVCDKHDTKFIEYRPHTGSWVFRVEHFSKYGLTDSDEEDDETPDVIKRQLVHQTLQKQAPTQPSVSKPLPPVGGLGGLGGGGLGGLGLSGGHLISSEDSIFAMQQTSINLLSGASKAFEMDTTEENAEGHSLYQDSRALSVKSPTSELAKLENRQSAHLQLMKASLYADTEMDEDDASVSTGDQLVPLVAPSAGHSEPPALPRLVRQDTDVEIDSTQPTEEVSMKPLLVQPHTIVLRYHRKIPPFKNTIAGRLGASCIADLAVSRARHSRVGFGPGGVIVFPTTYQAVNNLPNSAELSELSKYVAGRGADDWSESVVARLGIAQPDSHYDVQEVLSRHLESLFEFSTFVEPTHASSCPRLRLSDSPRERYAALQQMIRDAEDKRGGRQKFGVSGAYCLEVWKLCDALWGADLENDGVPAKTDAAIVDRHRRFLAWLRACVSDVTDSQLAQPTHGEKEDAEDGHSARVWTLLLGGRVLEACRVARDHGDLNMATLIAQASGDPTFRALVARQLSLWRECGADGLVSASRLATLSLLSGSHCDQLHDAHWTQALLYTHSYLSPAVPSLEQVVRRYEGLFVEGEEQQEGEVDLSTLPAHEMGMQYPLPDHVHTDVESGATQRRVLDLRYALIRARAMNSVCSARPGQYTPDPLDYSLSFLLGVWFGCPTPESVTGAAHQLEAAGRWHSAVHALCYLPDDKDRVHLIRAVLSRHAPARGESDARLGLLARLRVPRDWLLLAQAHRAKYEHLPQLEAQHLAGAGRWSDAHRVLIQQLLPNAVLADDLDSISPLLQQLSEAAARSEVSGWEAGGAALHQYMQVCAEIRSLVGSQPAGAASVSRRLEALRPALASACKALAQLPPSTARMACARAEMGARLVQLSCAGGAPPPALAALIHHLRLPPDTTHHAHAKITSELAEQASELSIESATDSPPSHRHAARPIQI